MEASDNNNRSRKLASVQLVEEVKIHTNANSLELALILGWQVVIKKDEVKKGQKVVYFEIDSILPDKPWSQFMRERKFRIKTIKLRGEISQKTPYRSSINLGSKDVYIIR